jgi:hypothetical protein
MGQGNYLPPNDEVYPHLCEDFDVRCDPVYEMVYVEYTFTDLGPMSMQDAFVEELSRKIDQLLPDSFYLTKTDHLCRWESKTVKIELKNM